MFKTIAYNIGKIFINKMLYHSNYTYPIQISTKIIK